MISWLEKSVATCKSPSLETDNQNPITSHPSPLTANRHLRDVLIAKGYELKYQEFAGHHSSVNWRGTFSDALLFFLDNQSVGP